MYFKDVISFKNSYPSAFVEVLALGLSFVWYIAPITYTSKTILIIIFSCTDTLYLGYIRQYVRISFRHNINMF